MEEDKHEDSASAANTIVAEAVRTPTRDAPPEAIVLATYATNQLQARKPGEKWKADEVHTLPAK